MDSDAVFEQLKHFRKSSPRFVADWPLGWLDRCESAPPALRPRNANFVKKTMNSDAAFKQVTKSKFAPERTSSPAGSLESWMGTWLDGNENNICHGAGATAQKVASWRDILILAGVLKQKLARRAGRHESAKLSSKKRRAKVGKT